MRGAQRRNSLEEGGDGRRPQRGVSTGAHQFFPVSPPDSSVFDRGSVFGPFKSGLTGVLLWKLRSLRGEISVILLTGRVGSGSGQTDRYVVFKIRLYLPMFNFPKNLKLLFLEG